MKKGSIKIIKIDKNDSKIKLENVKFQILDESDNVIQEGRTDQNGEIVFEDILIGKYFINEVETKEGYMIHERKIEVNLEDGKMEEIIVENEKIPEKPTEPEEPLQPEEPQKPIEPVQPERTEEIEEPLQPSEPENYRENNYSKQRTS